MRVSDSLPIKRGPSRGLSITQHGDSMRLEWVRDNDDNCEWVQEWNHEMYVTMYRRAPRMNKYDRGTESNETSDNMIP